MKELVSSSTEQSQQPMLNSLPGIFKSRRQTIMLLPSKMAMTTPKIVPSTNSHLTHPAGSTGTLGRIVQRLSISNSSKGQENKPGKHRPSLLSTWRRSRFSLKSDKNKIDRDRSPLENYNQPHANRRLNKQFVDPRNRYLSDSDSSGSLKLQNTSADLGSNSSSVVVEKRQPIDRTRRKGFTLPRSTLSYKPFDLKENQPTNSSMETLPINASSHPAYRSNNNSFQTQFCSPRTDGIIQNSSLEITNTSDEVANSYSCNTPVSTQWDDQLRISTNCEIKDCRLIVGCTLFNRDPKEGIEYLQTHGLLPTEPSGIARFFYSQANLSRQAIGEYFGMINHPVATKVLKEYLQLFDMRNLSIDQALRLILSHFHPTGESQKITHLMQLFQDVYMKQNWEQVSNDYKKLETIEILAYSILMLHTDLHNPNLRRLGQHMSEDDFIQNNRGIDDGADVPQDQLRAIYQRVAAKKFENVPDPVDTLRQLDEILVGPLKTTNFVQRHRRFIGWVLGQLVDCVPNRQMAQNKHWRYLFIFNDLILITKPIVEPLLNQSNSLRTLSTNKYADYTFVDRNTRKFYSEKPMLSGRFHVRNVLMMREINILVFETQSQPYGTRLCLRSGPMFNFSMPSNTTRQKLIDWVQTAMAELTELTSHSQKTINHHSITNMSHQRNPAV